MKMRTVCVGHAQYVSLREINRFNRDNRYLQDFYKYLEHTWGGSKRKVGHAKWIKKAGIPEEILISAMINSEVYHMVQSRLQQITGRLWPMDEFIHLLFSWFIAVYSDLKNIQNTKPFKYKINVRRVGLKKKFEEKFSPYYSNIMGTWEDYI